MNEQTIGALTLLIGAGPVLMLLGVLVGVQKRRSLVNGVDWSRVADPDALLARLGTTVGAGGMAFSLLGAALLLDLLPAWAVAPAVLAVAIPMTIVSLALIARAQAPRPGARRPGSPQP